MSDDKQILNMNILIVDDDDDLREIYYELLNFEGFENVFQAEDGLSAIEAAKKDKMSLILSDLNMPGIDGIETIIQIKEFQPEISSMILTGFGSMDVAITAFSEGKVDEFLNKPIDNEDLISKIKNLLKNKKPDKVNLDNDMVRFGFAGGKNFFGQFLVDNGYINEEELIDSLQEHKIRGQLLGVTMVELGYITDEKLVKALSEHKGYPIATEKDLSMITDETLLLIAEKFAREHCLIPFLLSNNELSVAMTYPDDLQVTDTLKMLTRKDIFPFVAPKSLIDSSIEHYYSKLETANKATSALNALFDGDEIDVTEIVDEASEADEDDADSAPVIKLVAGILQKAVIDGTSDIHIEPEDKHLQIRFRKDGVLYYPTGYERLPKKLFNPLIARIKILADLKIDVKLRTQDGKIRLKIGSGEIDFRVSTLPTIWGEKAVLRILKSDGVFPIEAIFGGNENYINIFKRSIKRKDGMVLVTGPTGSGKTNTLASALNYIKDVSINIIEVADPIEITNPGINQVQVNPQQGLTFAGALRSILRQDPDVVLVGEMRDYETAHIGCEAALTGHLVFSTLHTNDAPSTITRFVEMGIKEYLIGTVVHLVVAQRLVKTICKMCKKEHKYEDSALKGIGLTDEEIKDVTFYKGEGCANCRDTGNAGRAAIIEMLELTPKIRSAIMANATSIELGTLGKEEGTYFTLKDDAIQKFKDGSIDLTETLKYTTLIE